MKCKDATALCSKALDLGLTAREKATLAIHVLGCSSCDLYRRQAGFISGAMKAYGLRHRSAQRLPPADSGADPSMPTEE